MRLKLDKLKKNPVQFQSLTGFLPLEFDELATEFRIEWDQHSSHFTLDGKQRQRIALPRKTNVLPGYQDKLLFLSGVFENISITGTTGGGIFYVTASSQFLDTPFQPNSSENAQKA